MANTLPKEILEQLSFIPFPEGLDCEQVGDWLASEGVDGDVIVLETGLVVPFDSVEYTETLLKKCVKFFNDD